MTRLGGLVVVSVLVGSAASAQGIDKAYAKVAPSVVTVRADRTGTPGLEGAGVVLHGDGFIGTAAHLVAQSDSISVRFGDGTLAAAKLVTLSRSEDTALLKVDKLPSGAPAATLGDSDKVAVGQQLFAVAPDTRALSLGVVRSIRGGDARTSIAPRQMIHVDDALTEARFGGPLFNASGEVVALLTNISAVGGATSGKAFATPSNQVRKRLFDNALPYVGMALRYVPPEMARVFNWPVEHALLVEWVKPGSAAENAGIRGGTVDAIVGGVPIRLGGDLIVKTGDLDISKLDEIGQYLHSRKTGSVLHYQLIRNGKPVEADVIVEEVIKVPALKAAAAKK